MLVIANRLSDLSFNSLMRIYVEGNLENGQESWPGEPEARQIALAEQDFYDYLQQTFFRTPGAAYFIWHVDGQYVSALRLEPYEDGLLLEALETVPDQRRKGYAKALIGAVLDWLREHGCVRVYSHVNKRNTASLATHKSCGFRKILDHAVYTDGSVISSSVTLIYAE